MIVDSASYLLNQYASSVAALKPGQAIRFELNELCDQVGGWHYGGVRWNPADQILHIVVGSAYGYSYEESKMGDFVTFFRCIDPLPPGAKTHVDPDQRFAFERRSDGWFYSRFAKP